MCKEQGMVWSNKGPNPTKSMGVPLMPVGANLGWEISIIDVGLCQTFRVWILGLHFPEVWCFQVPAAHLYLKIWTKA